YCFLLREIVMFSTPFLLLLACTSSAVAVKARYSYRDETLQGCEWRGQGPMCGHYDCLPGTREVMRLSRNERQASFGTICWSGEKTLCCKEDAIPDDLKKNCALNKRGDKHCSSRKVRITEVSWYNEGQFNGSTPYCCNEKAMPKKKQ
ncbi:hypothetical protein PFISCL1PPCAC_24036, partial [Pristionchus fissidentatus]